MEIYDKDGDLHSQYLIGCKYNTVKIIKLLQFDNLAPMEWDGSLDTKAADQLLTRRLLLELIQLLKIPGEIIAHSHWGKELTNFGPPIEGFKNYEELP